MNSDNTEPDTFVKYCKRVDKPLLQDIMASEFRRPNNGRQIQNHGKKYNPNDLSQVKLPYQENQHIFHDVGPRMRNRDSTSSSGDSSAPPNPQAPVVFKTVICANWANGRCRYGDRCWYAHGVNDMNQKAREAPTMETMDTVYYKDMPNYHETNGPYETTVAQQQWMRMSYPSQEKPRMLHKEFQEPVTRFVRDGVIAQFRAGVEACLVDNRPASPMPFSLDDKPKKDEISEEATSILASLSFLQQKEEKCDAGVCDIYSASGFCPLGDECLLKHVLPNDA